MADVQIQQTPDAGSSGSGAWVWGLIVLILLGVIAWFVFGGGLHRTTTAKVDINVPGAVSPPAPSSSGGTAGGSVPPATSSPTKKP
ncbi:MAG TPA: hypothetical protein VNC18_09545 [Gemmatimonadaceae bacterium]|jgi:hypothetical protein|nr:hypothetical protein [Gemmatimonadaceae bacterium]